MEVPDDLRYSPDHEWVRIEVGTGGAADGAEGAVVRMGITDYAQDALGDVVYVELPELGKVAGAGESLSEVESTKSVNDIFAPVAGEVIEVNAALVDAPELLNRDPYGEGWICVLKISGLQLASELLDAAAYRALIEG
jgi:glycine cleavage system H protein